jgi:hypothetical protein
MAIRQQGHPGKMNLAAWEGIARRQAWYVIVLEQKLAEWPKERTDACTDLETLRSVLALAERVDRHEQLMIRHLSKGVSLLPGSQGVQPNRGLKQLSARHRR